MKVFVNERILVSNELWIPKNQIEFENNLESLIDSLHCFNFFNECEVFYNSEGISELFKNIDFINEEEQYPLFDKIAQLRELFKDSSKVTDWFYGKIQKNDHNYLIQLGNGFCPHPADGTSIAEATEYKFQNEKIVILNLISSEFNLNNKMYVNRVNTIPPNEMNLIELDLIYNQNNTLEYYFENRTKIEFNLNPKHGENHTKLKIIDGEEVSPLECTKEEANILLQIAIGNKNTSKLFAFDIKREKFIEFKYDNTTNPTTYHGYHPHKQKIPNDIQSFLKKIQPSD